MTHRFFKNYEWAKGKPRGIDLIQENVLPNFEISFRIVTDPYMKWITIEKYRYGIFQSLSYDSSRFDFRHLKPMEQVAWKKESILETQEKALFWIRNHDDRIILKEECCFVEGICRESIMSCPHGILIAIQKMHYKQLGDEFNGIILLDILNHPVLTKKYKECHDGLFLDLIEEKF